MSIRPAVHSVLIHGKALDADVLVPMAIKRGHAGKLVATFRE